MICGPMIPRRLTTTESWPANAQRRPCKPKVTTTVLSSVSAPDTVTAAYSSKHWLIHSSGFGVVIKHHPEKSSQHEIYDISHHSPPASPDRPGHFSPGRAQRHNSRT